jgi:hypothetical protein
MTVPFCAIGQMVNKCRTAVGGERGLTYWLMKLGICLGWYTLLAVDACPWIGLPIHRPKIKDSRLDVQDYYPMIGIASCLPFLVARMPTLEGIPVPALVDRATSVVQRVRHAAYLTTAMQIVRWTIRMESR